MKIGYKDENYPSKRNILNVVPGASYVKVTDLNRLIRSASRAASRVLQRRMPDSLELQFRFADFDMNRVDLLHFFNSISYGTTPWITTFETVVPRFTSTQSRHLGPVGDFSALAHEAKIVKAMAALADPSCRQIIALSECNLRMQLDLARHFPEYCPKIERKLICLHPPQRTIVEDFAEKQLPLDEEIRFMFVGKAFFRKGGREILEAFKEARGTFGDRLKLIIVSSLSIDDYATKETQEDVARARQLIAESSDWVEYWERLENDKVLELMKGAHVGLLPTHADTYGYSVLEFQAAGCPVISTNVRALPEINSNETGWVIDVPKNRLGEGIYTTAEDRTKMSGAIKSGLARAIAEIMDDSQAIPGKGNASIRQIRTNHSPEDFARRLGAICRDAQTMRM